MKLEQQVPSLELCKRLKELGYPQESLLYWAQSEFENEKPELTFYRSQKEFDDREGMGKFVGVWSHGDVEIGSFTETYSAPTVAEMGEMLPSDIVSGRTPNSTSNGWDNWECLDFIEFASAAYHHDDSKVKKARFIADTEANARAKMLIYLLENKLISL